MSLPVIVMTFPVRDETNNEITSKREYPDSVLLSGGIPVLVPPFTEEETHSALLDRADGLILTGGCDVAPERYGMEKSPLCGFIRHRGDFALISW